jgi:hypothetical protein
MNFRNLVKLGYVEMEYKRIVTDERPSSALPRRQVNTILWHLFHARPAGDDWYAV